MYALDALKTTQARLDAGARRAEDAQPRGSPRRRRRSRKVQADTSLSATNRLLAATVAANTLSNVIQRQNQLDQFIGDDQSLLEQIKQRRADPDHHAAPRRRKVTAGGKSASSASRSCSERSPASRWHYCHMWWFRRDARRRRWQSGRS